jgi:general stress protein 26
MTPEHLLKVAVATIKAAQYCFLITLSEAGQANARLMQPFEPEPDLTIWFGASPTSRKVQEIRRNSQVTLAYHDAQENAYAILSGLAHVVSDKDLKRKYWRDGWKAFWPQGPESDEYVLIKLTPTQIELMNFAQHVTPQPYGLQPVVLIKEGNVWVVKA